MVEHRSLGFLLAVCCASPIPAFAQTASGGDAATLRSARIELDTSARSSPATGPFSLRVSVDGLRDGGERIPLVDAIDLTVERDVAEPAVFDLALRQPIAKDDLDQIVTTLTSASTADRFVFHYTLTLTFEAAGATSTVLQKVYAVTLGGVSTIAMTQTSVGEPPSTYAELAATYALMESAIERKMQRSIRPPIWTHHVLGNLRMDGEQAVMTVRQAYSRMQFVNGKLRKVETSVTQDETWTRTPAGWKRRFVENEQDLEWYVDGKRIEPGRRRSLRPPVGRPRGDARLAP